MHEALSEVLFDSTYLHRTDDLKFREGNLAAS